jgi:tripartite-type tricarboxylate transporter receptor subunit TctC
MSRYPVAMLRWIDGNKRRRKVAMRQRFLLLVLVASLWTGSIPVLAAYPDKPIRLVVPSAPGGAPDVLMRALATQLSTQMGVPIVIDNKPGGSYLIGTMDLVRSPPDGYTLGYGNIVSLATNRSLIADMPYDVDKDLTLISNALRVSNLLVVNNDLPIRSVAELIAYAKKNPGKLAFASDGNGSTAHLGGELFKSMTGTDMLHVPYKAATAAVTDLIGGNIQLMIVNTPVSGPQAQAGRVRALGISSSQRSPTYPDIPTIAESGVPGFEVVAWGGIIGPAHMPKEIVAKLNAEIRTALASAAVRERFKALGAETDPGTPEEFRELARRETAKWAKVVKFSGAKVD